jgi:hypothetical protein
MSDDTSCIAILQGTFNEGGQHTPEFKEYSQRSNANGQANGGKVLGKYLITENLGQGEGTTCDVCGGVSFAGYC